MATPPQENEAVPKCAVLTKMQWAPCATNPIPPPSPDSYTGKTWEDPVNDIEDCQPEDMATTFKWYDSDEDSDSSQCPKKKNYSCKRPPII